MISFCLKVRWGGAPVSCSEVDELADALPAGWGDDRWSTQVPGAAVTTRLRRVDKTESAAAAVQIDQNRRRLIVGDIRLYRALAKEPVPARSALAAFDGGPARLAALCGDFAFVIWDWGEEVAWAARDQFGMRPLFYRPLSDGVVFASDVRQLLAVRPVDRDIDPQMVLDYLTNDYGEAGRSFFKSIKAVRPSHIAKVDRSQLSCTDYWDPRPDRVNKGSPASYVAEWRSTFRAAVEDRLISDYPIAAHLSGGLDSSSIVGAAHQVYERDVIERPPLTALSAVFPGLSCDQTDVIDDVLSRSPLFSSRKWSPVAKMQVEEIGRFLPFPNLRRGAAQAYWGDVHLVGELGARVLLTGTGGDEVSVARGIYRDLFSHLAITTIVREMFQAPSAAHRRSFIRDGLRGLVPTSMIGRRPRFLEPSVPEWLGPELSRIYATRDRKSRPDRKTRTESHLEFRVRSVLKSASLATAIQSMVLAGREGLAEVRMPYLDISLINFVLSIPWRDRIPRGDPRRLQREAVHPYVPASVLRAPKMTFQDAVALELKGRHLATSEILRHGSWESAPFVDRPKTVRILSELEVRDPMFASHREWRQVFRIAELEAWLRGLGRYNPRGAKR